MSKPKFPKIMFELNHFSVPCFHRHFLQIYMVQSENIHNHHFIVRNAIKKNITWNNVQNILQKNKRSFQQFLQVIVNVLGFTINIVTHISQYNIYIRYEEKKIVIINHVIKFDRQVPYHLRIAINMSHRKVKYYSIHKKLI